MSHSPKAAWGCRIKKGQSDSGTVLVVNGEEAVMLGDGTFRYLTNPLPAGENMITVTAQDTKGGYNTWSHPVTIQ